MRFTGLVVAACLAAVGIIAGPAPTRTLNPAQSTQPAQTPTFRSRTDLVRLSIRVIDNKTGQPVTNLGPGDFTVTENGVLREVSTFSIEQRDPEAGPVVASGSAASLPRRRVFLIVLGQGRVEGPIHPYEGAIKFLRERMLPDDLVAVLAFNRATPFSTDHERAARIVEQVRARNNGVIFKLMVDVAKRLRNDLPLEVQEAIDATFQAAGGDPVALRNVMTMLLGVSEFRQNDTNWHWRPWNRMVLSRDLLKVYAGLEYLRHVEGEKHLVYLGLGLTRPSIEFVNIQPVGLHLDSRQDDERVAARANDAGVTLDIIHTGGVGLSSGAWAVSASKNVTEWSGGQFSNNHTADRALSRVDDATRFGYVLGYAPANPELDGKYRNVDVKVNRKGVTALFAHGYTARPDPPPLSLREIVTRARLRDAAATDVGQDDIKLQATAAVAPGTDGVRQVRVDLTIDASRLTFTEADGRHNGAIDVLIVCGNAKQEVVCYRNQHMQMSLTSDLYQRAMGSGIPRIEVVPLAGAATFVKVLVYDYDADLLGSANIRLR